MSHIIMDHRVKPGDDAESAAMLGDSLAAVAYRGQSVSTKVRKALKAKLKKENRPHRHGGAQGQSACGKLLGEAGV